MKCYNVKCLEPKTSSFPVVAILAENQLNARVLILSPFPEHLLYKLHTCMVWTGFVKSYTSTQSSHGPSSLALAGADTKIWTFC